MIESHTAIEKIEEKGAAGFWHAREIFGDAGAFALVTMILRHRIHAQHGPAIGSEVRPRTNGLLHEQLNAVYAVFSQNPLLISSKEGRCLENDAACKMLFRTRIYPTATHAFLAEMFTRSDESLIKESANSQPIAEFVRHTASPDEARNVAMSDRFAPYIREDWNEEVMRASMRRILRSKLERHSCVRATLVNSKKRLIAADTDTDPFWGYGEFWTGENHLGRIWMELRDELL